MRIDHTHTGRPCNGAPAVDRRHDDSALPIRAQATGSRHLPVPASGRPRAGGGRARPGRASREPYRVYSEREFLTLLEREPRLGWASESTLGVDLSVLGTETCSRAAGASLAGWQKIGLLSTAAILTGATGAAAALLGAAGPRQLVASGRRPVGAVPVARPMFAPDRARAAVVVAPTSRPRAAKRSPQHGGSAPRVQARPRAAGVGSRPRVAEGRSKAGRAQTRSVGAARALPPAPRVRQSPHAPAANLSSSPTASATPQRGGAGSGAPRSADFSFER